jgi:hypothetical protein
MILIMLDDLKIMLLDRGGTAYQEKDQPGHPIG